MRVCVCAHMYLYQSIYLCVCMYVCVYMCIYMERKIDRCSVVKEKPFVTYPHGHIKSFTQLFLIWHSFEMASSLCDTICKGGRSAHLQDIPVEFLKNGPLVYIC